MVQACSVGTGHGSAACRLHERYCGTIRNIARLGQHRMEGETVKSHPRGSPGCSDTSTRGSHGRRWRPHSRRLSCDIPAETLLIGYWRKGGCLEWRAGLDYRDSYILPHSIVLVFAARHAKRRPLRSSEIALAPEKVGNLLEARGWVDLVCRPKCKLAVLYAFAAEVWVESAVLVRV